MEFTILDMLSVLISGVLSYLILSLFMHKADKSKKKNDDTNIEWYGPNVYLKKKNYGEIVDDHREKIIKK